MKELIGEYDLPMMIGAILFGIGFILLALDTLVTRIKVLKDARAVELKRRKFLIPGTIFLFLGLAVMIVLYMNIG